MYAGSFLRGSTLGESCLASCYTTLAGRTLNFGFYRQPTPEGPVFYLRINGVRIRPPDPFAAARQEVAYQWYLDTYLMFHQAEMTTPCLTSVLV